MPTPELCPTCGQRVPHPDAKSRGARRRRRLVAAMVVALGLALVGGVAWLSGDALLHPAPSGWTRFTDAEGGYRVFLPGEPPDPPEGPLRALFAAKKPPAHGFPSHYSGTDKIQGLIESHPIQAGVPIPTDPEALVKYYAKLTTFDVRDKLTAVTLSGRTGAEARTYARGWSEEPPEDPEKRAVLPPEEMERAKEEYRAALASYEKRKPLRERQAQEARARGQCAVRYLLSTERRFYAITVTTAGGYADEAVLAIVRDSFVTR